MTQNLSTITSGLYKGYKLASPRSAQTHPMGSRERLALFNSLSSYLPGADVLDAYAGTGALGIEALSRGAKSATFIENSHQTFEILAKNLSNLSPAPNHTTLMQADFFKILPELSTYDIIFLDPPYNHFEIPPFSELKAHLRSGGVIVLSHPRAFDPVSWSGIEPQATKTFAAANLSIFTNI